MTFPRSFRMIFAHLVAMSSCIVVTAGCGVESGEPADESSEEVSQDVDACTGNGPGVFDMVCGVGLSSTGQLSMKFKNAWWSVDYFNGYWDIKNSVIATPLDVAPTTWTTDETPPCNCGPCDPNSGSGYPACQEACRHACENIPHITTAHV